MKDKVVKKYINYRTGSGMVLTAERQRDRIVVYLSTPRAHDLSNVNLLAMVQAIEVHIAARPSTPINPANLNILVTDAIVACNNSRNTPTYSVFRYKRTEIKHLGDLAQQDRETLWRTTRNLGQSSMKVLDEILAMHGLEWNMTLAELGNWKPPTEQ